MPHDLPWRVQVRAHPGSSAQEIHDETEWTGGHQHRIGFRNRQDRLPGLTHDEDADERPESDTSNSTSNTDGSSEEEFDEEAKQTWSSSRSDEVKAILSISVMSSLARKTIISVTRKTGVWDGGTY